MRPSPFFWKQAAIHVPHSKHIPEHLIQEPVLVAVVLSLVTIALYSGSSGNSFINYDDGIYVTANAHVWRGMNWDSAAWAFQAQEAANWHPLTWLSLELDGTLYGLDASGYHLSNVLLHAASAGLLFGVLWLWTKAMWRSAMVAALFAWHPLHVESVAWAAERKDVLCGFFFMLSLWAYARYVRSEGKRRRAGSYLLLLAAFSLALMAKPMAVTLPLVLLLLDYWPLGRWVHDASQLRRSAFQGLLAEKIPLLALAAIFSAVTMSVQGQAYAIRTWEQFPLWIRLGNAAETACLYLMKTFWPSQLMPFYPHVGQGISTGWAVGAAMTVLAISGIAVLLISRLPYLAVGWFWYLGMLVPVSGLVQVGLQAMADRYTYLPLIGAFLVCSWGLTDLVRAKVLPQELAVTACVLALGACCLLSWRQTLLWRDSVALWSHAVECNANNAQAQLSLGSALKPHGDTSGALRHLQESLRLNEANAEAHNNVGIILEENGETANALQHFRRAVEIEPNNADAHYNLGHVLDRFGNKTEATNEYRLALQIDPGHFAACLNLGQTMAQLGKLDEALNQFRQAIDLDPERAEAHYDLALALTDKGESAQAIHEYEEALRLNPSNPQAHNNLGQLFEDENNFVEASKHYAAAYRLQPRFALALANLGLVLAAQGQAEAGAEALQRAIGLDPQSVKFYYDLGHVLRQAGKTEESKKVYQQAAQMNSKWLLEANTMARNLAASSHGVPGFRGLLLAQEICEATDYQEPDYLDTLAVAYAVRRRFQEAIQMEQKAIKILRASGRMNEIPAIEQRINLYESGKAHERAIP
jgi:tetratricopeptide (TPR) repeat protein